MEKKKIEKVSMEEIQTINKNSNISRSSIYKIYVREAKKAQEELDNQSAPQR